MGTVIELIDPNFCIVNFAVVAVLFLSLFFCFFFLFFFCFFLFFVFVFLLFSSLFVFFIYLFFKGKGERVHLNLKNAQSDQFNQKLLSFA